MKIAFSIQLFSVLLLLLSLPSGSHVTVMSIGMDWIGSPLHHSSCDAFQCEWKSQVFNLSMLQVKCVCWLQFVHTYYFWIFFCASSSGNDISGCIFIPLPDYSDTKKNPAFHAQKLKRNFRNMQWSNPTWIIDSKMRSLAESRSWGFTNASRASWSSRYKRFHP